jgi:hypothetical protein
MKIGFAFSLFSVSTNWTSISTQETRSAGGPPSALLRLWGLHGLAFTAGVSNTRSNQLCFKRNNTFCLQTNNKGESEYSNTDDGKETDF